jgi:hypothetical protein
MLCALLEQVTVPLFVFISVLRSHNLHRLHNVVASHTPLERPCATATRSGSPKLLSGALPPPTNRSCGTAIPV